MNTYKVDLTRVYTVTVNAESEDEARHYAEFFVGDCRDLSQKKERQEHNFSIANIEMMYNDAVRRHD